MQKLLGVPGIVIIPESKEAVCLWSVVTSDGGREKGEKRCYLKTVVSLPASYELHFHITTY